MTCRHLTIFFLYHLPPNSPFFQEIKYLFSPFFAGQFTQSVLQKKYVRVYKKKVNVTFFPLFNYVFIIMISDLKKKNCYHLKKSDSSLSPWHCIVEIISKTSKQKAFLSKFVVKVSENQVFVHYISTRSNKYLLLTKF